MARSHVPTGRRARPRSLAVVAMGAAFAVVGAISGLPGCGSPTTDLPQPSSDSSVGGVSGPSAAPSGGTSAGVPPLPPQCQPRLGPAPPVPAVTPATQQCTASSDCAIVTYGCCDPCNGGKYLAVATKHRDALATAAREHNTFHCPPICELGPEGYSIHFGACTALGCPPLVATCESGTCVGKYGSF